MSTIAAPGMRARARRLFVRVHGPTWLVAVAVYGGWLALTLAHDGIPLPLLMVLGGIVIAWHGSLQHETIHGHPAGPPWLAGALGAAPLSLWLPYGVYRDTHRRHHATEHLTDPEHDPESPFRHAHQPYLLGSFGRALALSQRTTLGRLVLGPLLCIGRFVASEARLVWGGAPGRRRAWLLHALAVSVVLAWLMGVVAMPLWKYVVSFVYPGASLTLLRSLAEHRSDVVRARRTTVVEAGLFCRSRTSGRATSSSSARSAGTRFAARFKDQLRIVGVPDYEAPGCTRGHHRSFIIVNTDSLAKNLDDLLGAVAVINDVESVTGRHLLGDALAGIGATASFFSRIDVSGSHANSLARVAEGEADVAAIDCISYHHLAHAAPRVAARTRIVHWSRPTPSPPFVIATAGGEATASLVALAVRDAFADPATEKARRTLRIAGIRSSRPAEYARAQLYAERADPILQ